MLLESKSNSFLASATIRAVFIYFSTPFSSLFLCHRKTREKYEKCQTIRFIFISCCESHCEQLEEGRAWKNYHKIIHEPPPTSEMYGRKNSHITKKKVNSDYIGSRALDVCLNWNTDGYLWNYHFNRVTGTFQVSKGGLWRIFWDCFVIDASKLRVSMSLWAHYKWTPSWNPNSQRRKSHCKWKAERRKVLRELFEFFDLKSKKCAIKSIEFLFKKNLIIWGAACLAESFINPPSQFPSRQQQGQIRSEPV